MTQINPVENPGIDSAFEEAKCCWHVERGRTRIDGTLKIPTPEQRIAR